MGMRRTLSIAVVVTLSFVLVAAPARRHVRGLTLVVRAAEVGGLARRLADLDTVLINEQRLEIAAKSATMAGRLFLPDSAARQTVLLVSGLHPAGIDEPRLTSLARRLAEAKVTVVTDDIPEPSRFEITPALTDRIEEAAVWLATTSGLAPDGRIGLMGISFSGGLAVVAATTARQELCRPCRALACALAAPHRARLPSSRERRHGHPRNRGPSSGRAPPRSCSRAAARDRRHLACRGRPTSSAH